MSRKHGKGRGKGRGAAPRDCKHLSPADQLRAALGELADTPRDSRGKGRGKRRHVDDYREHLLNSSDDRPLSEALLDLTQETHRRRRRLLPDETPTVRLPEGRQAKDPQGIANEATGEIEDDMKRHGIPGPTHYYSARERRETGEVDRTYEIGRKRSKARRSRKRS